MRALAMMVEPHGLRSEAGHRYAVGSVVVWGCGECLGQGGEYLEGGDGPGHFKGVSGELAEWSAEPGKLP